MGNGHGHQRAHVLPRKPERHLVPSTINSGCYVGKPFLGKTVRLGLSEKQDELLWEWFRKGKGTGEQGMC